MKWILLLTTTLLFSLNAFAFPQAPVNSLDFQGDLSKDNGQYDFEGIIKLSNCSGSVIRFAGQPDTSPAIVMTNGHCTPGMVGPGEFKVNERVNRRMKVAKTKNDFYPVKAKKLLYATMTYTDIAFYELKQTYEDLQKWDIHPFYLDSDHPLVGLPMDVVSGYWRRGYRCSVDSFIFQLLEAGWTFKDSIKYTQPGCETIGGTSGSPIIETNTRTVIGINNTGNEDGKECTMNNPCEVTQHGDMSVEEGASYGQQTHIVYTCLTPDYNIDLSLPGCLLPH